MPVKMPLLLLPPLPLLLLLLAAAASSSRDAGSFAGCERMFFDGAPPEPPHQKEQEQEQALALEGPRFHRLCVKDGRHDAHFAVRFDTATRTPAYVAYALRFRPSKTALLSKDSALSCDGKWRQSDQLDAALQATDSDFAKGYDRGHLAPAKTFSYSCAAECATYTFVNAAPQQKDCNRNVWLKTERFLRNYLAAHPKNEVFVITGTVFRQDADHDDLAYLHQKKNTKTRVGTPGSFYTVVWDPAGGVGWGFVVENSLRHAKEFCKGNTPTLLTLEEVEEVVGAKFFVEKNMMSNCFGGLCSTADMVIKDPPKDAKWFEQLGIGAQSHGDATAGRKNEVDSVWTTEPSSASPGILVKCNAMCDKFEQQMMTHTDCAKMVGGFKYFFKSREGKKRSKRKRQVCQDLSRCYATGKPLCAKTCESTCKGIVDPYLRAFKENKYQGDMLVGLGKSSELPTGIFDNKEALKLDDKFDILGRFGGANKMDELVAWDSCDAQLDGEDPMTVVDIKNRLVAEGDEAAVERFNGILLDRQYRCAAFRLKEEKGYFSRGEKETVVVCEDHRVDKWMKLFAPGK
jgi:DNA/RNA endonuclease G (NUC1)